MKQQVIEKLQTSEKKLTIMNFTIPVKTLPKELKQYLITHIKNKTCDYFDFARCNWDKFENTVIGFQVYRDYFICMDIYFLSNDGYYTGVELGRVYNNKVSLTAWLNTTNFDEVKKQFNDIIKDKNLDIIKDYDYEQIMDAIACGDYDLVDDIVGDRDLAELI